MCFGLVDEASKLNLNMRPTLGASNQLIWLPRMTVDLTQGILDWVNTNGTGATVTYYAMQQPSYQCKCEPFETVDELRLVYGADMDTLVGEDANRNGILDPSENDENQNGMLDPGILEYVTVYSREPNTNSDGSAKVNISSLSSGSTNLISLLQTNFGAARATVILGNLGLVSGPSRGTAGQHPPAGRAAAVPARSAAAAAGTPGGGTGAVSFASPLQFYVKSGMTETEFALIATNLTTTNGSYINGRVNVNTASAAVLSLPARGRPGGGAATGQLSPIQPEQSDVDCVGYRCAGPGLCGRPPGPRGRGLYHDAQVTSVPPISPPSALMAAGIGG